LIHQCRRSCSLARALDWGNSSLDSLEIQQPCTITSLLALEGMKAAKFLPQYALSASDVKLTVRAFYDFLRASITRSADP